MKRLQPVRYLCVSLRGRKLVHGRQIAALRGRRRVGVSGILGKVELRDRHVVITGGSRGIGAQLAERFKQEGARLSLIARASDALTQLSERLNASPYEADLTDPAQVHGLITRVEAQSGPVDVLVNDAGITKAGDFVAEQWEDVEALFRLNLLTPAELCHQVLPGMLARGCGHIVNMSSLSGVTILPGLTAYSASKAGLSQFTAGLRADLRGRPVGTTLVELGPVSTDLLSSAKRYQPVDDSFARAYRLKLLTELDAPEVANQIVGAVRRGRRHVRMPKRAAPISLVVEAPRRATEWLLTGIDHQEHN